MAEDAVVIEDESGEEGDEGTILLVGVLGEQNSMIRDLRIKFTEDRCQISSKGLEGTEEMIADFRIRKILSCQPVQSSTNGVAHEGEENVILQLCRMDFSNPVQFAYSGHQRISENCVLLCGKFADYKFWPKLKNMLCSHPKLVSSPFLWKTEIATLSLHRFEIFCNKCASYLRRHTPRQSPESAARKGDGCEKVAGWKIGSVVLAPSAISRLEKKGFLDDSLIDFFLELIRAVVLEIDQVKRYYFFNSFFYTTLERSTADGYPMVRKWTKNLSLQQKSLFDFDYIFMPLNLGMSHWCLCVIVGPSLALRNADGLRFSSLDETNLDTPVNNGNKVAANQDEDEYIREKPAIIFMDSLRTADPKETIRDKIISYLQQEFENKRPDDFKKGVHVGGIDEWEYIPDPRIPHQHNGFDCGVYLIEYARHLAFRESLINGMLKEHRGKPSTVPRSTVWFSQAHVSYRRVAMRMMLEVMKEHPNWRNNVSIMERLRIFFNRSATSSQSFNPLRAPRMVAPKTPVYPKSPDPRVFHYRKSLVSPNFPLPQNRSIPQSPPSSCNSPSTSSRPRKSQMPIVHQTQERPSRGSSPPETLECGSPEPEIDEIASDDEIGLRAWQPERRRSIMDQLTSPGWKTSSVTSSYPVPLRKKHKHEKYDHGLPKDSYDRD